MKISAFTFIKNGQILGYPFIESINSILPIVDEFVINVGKSEDERLNLSVLEQVRKLAEFTVIKVLFILVEESKSTQTYANQ